MGSIEVIKNELLEIENRLCVVRAQLGAYETLDAENDRLRNLFRRLGIWQRAYPLDVFPKPDLKKAHEVLKANDMTLDAIRADTMRDMLGGIEGIVERALKGGE